MPNLQNYTYRARNAQNQIQTGVIQAVSLEAAKKILTAHNLTPLSLTVPRSFADFIPLFNRVGLKEKTLFARQLATMIEAGLSLSQALRLQLRQSKKGRFQVVLESIQNDLQDGFSFSSALAKFPDVFDPIFVNVVRSGEATGKLESVLTQLADTLEKDVAIQSKIKGALFYPVFIIITMIGVAILMITKVIPQLRSIFDGAGQQLPASTRGLLSLSDFVIHKWPLVILIIAIVVAAIRFFLRTDFGTELYSKVSLKAPVAGGILVNSAMGRFGRLLGMLLGSGVPLLEALRLINDSFTNRVYQKAMQDVASQVERGIPMSVPITANPIFPSMVGQMVSVGEQTGKMDEIMERLANYFDQEVESRVGGLASLIEPVVIVLLGIGVAYLVIAILLPIYQISSAIN